MIIQECQGRRTHWRWTLSGAENVPNGHDRRQIGLGSVRTLPKLFNAQDYILFKTQLKSELKSCLSTFQSYDCFKDLWWWYGYGMEGRIMGGIIWFGTVRDRGPIWLLRLCSWFYDIGRNTRPRDGQEQFQETNNQFRRLKNTSWTTWFYYQQKWH